MTLDQANKLIQSCAGQMNARYEKTVFDEWAVISLKDGKGQLLSYTGPRRKGFQENFLKDAGPLLTGLIGGGQHPGDFEFARQNPGTAYEAFMVLGSGLFLICNNTVQSMDAIAKDPQWLSAQVPFVELCDRVREDPLEV